MPRRKTPSSRPSNRRWWWPPLCCLLGLAVGFGVPYGTWLVYVLDREMAAAHWQAPTRVYARVQTLTPGLSRQQVQARLQASDYRPGDGGPGTYRERDGILVAQAPRRLDGFPPQVQVRFEGGRVDAVSRDPRLEPALIGTVSGTRDRLPVALGDVPAALVLGLQAVEDRRFAHHHGISPKAVLRALWANLRQGAIVQGGSTLTQQLVKTLFLTRERRWLRKFHEAALATLMEWRYEKDQILEAYLNEVFLGQDGHRAIHGVGLAAEFYFGKSLGQLRLEEHALLVGLLKGPSYYNPWRHPERARKRRDQVLMAMYDTGVISRSQRLQAAGRPLGVLSRPGGGTGSYPAYLGLVTRQLGRAISDSRVVGQQVISGLDRIQQKASEAALSEELGRVESARGLPAGSLQGAVLVLDRADGSVLAAVGDRNPRFAGFNRVRDARRPVGSLVKPFIVLAALRSGRYQLASVVPDEPFDWPLEDGSTWSPDNFDGTSHGPVRMIDALAYSYNQASARVGLAVGVDAVIDTLVGLGLQRRPAAHPSLLLGALELSPLEVGQLYLSLFNQAQATAVRAVMAVRDRNGRLSYQARSPSDPPPDVDAWLVRHALERAVQVGTGRSLARRLGGVEGMAAKTGTSNGLRDSWFLLADADRVVVVWVGRDDNAAAGISGATAALPVAAALIERTGYRPLPERVPEGGVYRWVDAQGRLADDNCPDPDYLPFRRGREPEERAPCAREKKRTWRFWE